MPAHGAIRRSGFAVLALAGACSAPQGAEESNCRALVAAEGAPQY